MACHERLCKWWRCCRSAVELRSIVVRRWASRQKRDVLAVWLAARDPHTPWWARGLALVVAAYALSPIDLIPDVIPVLGYLDDVVLVPLGIWLVLKGIPPYVMNECRRLADERIERPVSLLAAAVFITLWLTAAVGIVGFCCSTGWPG